MVFFSLFIPVPSFRFFPSFLPFLLLFPLGSLAASSGFQPSDPAPFFVESFESGIGNWSVSLGAWEVGKPVSAPGGVYRGEHVAGTGLDSFYPEGANSRLESFPLSLPPVQLEEQVTLKLAHWFSFARGDFGTVQIKVDGGAWETVSDSLSGKGGGWSQFIVDLTPYAGKRIQLGFLLISDLTKNCGAFSCPSYTNDWGWYIDELSITAGNISARPSEDFESGIGDWFASAGVWEVGETVRDPGGVYQGQYVVGTGMDSFYPEGAYSRLISPEISLDSQDSSPPFLRFWHWFSLSRGDLAVVQISADDGEWESVTDTLTGKGGNWSQQVVDLAKFSDKQIRLGFLLISDLTKNCGAFSCPSYTNDWGWYIDELSFENINVEVEPVFNEKETRPSSSRLPRVYPNPISTDAKIQFDLSEPAFVVLYVYDIGGKEVLRLDAGQFEMGQDHIIPVELYDLASGQYIYRMLISRARGQEFQNGVLTVVR